ncbi:DUF6683 family protein [Coralloluteibacterium thermophilus]|uniref:DUF6683 family protein n=1 Tax=Coralloluteibacterium thermophilum TaxID=2707049 RepID=A0ABV9NNI5_9GAMM
MRRKSPLAPFARMLLAAVVLPTVVHAQTIGDMPYINAVGAWHDTHLPRHRDEAAPAAEEVPAPDPGRRGLEVFAFSPDPGVRRDVNRKLAAAFAGEAAAWPDALQPLAAGPLSDGDFLTLLARPLGRGRDEMLDTLESGVLQREYARVLADAGYSPHNMGDVHAAFLIYAWAIVHGHDRPVPQGAYDAVRATLARGVQARGDAIPAMPAADLQSSAESFAVLTLLAAAAWKESGGEDAARLRDGLAAVCERLGVDVRRVALTERGFVQR